MQDNFYLFSRECKNVIVNILRYSVENSLHIDWVPFSFPFLQGELITKKYLKNSLSEFARYQAQSELGFRDIKI